MTTYWPKRYRDFEHVHLKETMFAETFISQVSDFHIELAPCGIEF